MLLIDAMQETTRIRLCGQLEVELGGDRIEDRLRGRQTPLIFALLVLSRGRAVTRDELIGAVWPYAPPVNPEGALRPLLSRLRQAIGPDTLVGRRELRLSLPGDADIDVERAYRAAARAESAVAERGWSATLENGSAVTEITARGFLVGHDGPWVEERRRELEELHLSALEWVAQAGIALGAAHLAEAERAARQLVRAVPLREAGHRLTMEALAARGEVAEALAAYEELRLLLRDELGTVPSESVRALHERLLAGETTGTRTTPATATTREVTAVERDGLPERLAQLLRAPWIGRGPALRRLEDAAAAVATGDSRHVFVTGEAGIGKTRLVAELASRLPHFQVLYGRCDEAELFPFGAWVDMLSSRVARMAPSDLAALVGPEGSGLAWLLPELGDRLVALADVPSGADLEMQRRQLFMAVVALVRGLAQRTPVLMIIDDLHWADRSSLLMSRHLAREPTLGPVLMLGTFRDSELHPGQPLLELIAEVERHSEAPRVHLVGMDDDEVASLIGSWHGKEVRAPTARAIRAETGGNPFFVNQLVRHLEEVGVPGEQPLTGDVGVPHSLRDVIAHRVARLPGPAGHILRVAALIGREFQLELLGSVAAVAEDALLDVLDAAVRAGLLVEVPPTPGRYSFAHALVRTALESELSATRRARLHLRIGEAIEQRHASKLEPWLEDLARHFGAAGPEATDRAVEYAVRAADQATARLAYEEAVRLLSHAVAFRRHADAADDVQLAELEHALATAQSAAGRWEAARAAFARAADAARAAGSAEAFARAALGHSGGTWDQYGTTDEASIELLEDALRGLPDEDSALRTQVLARRAVALYFADGDEDRVLASADEAVAMARRIGDPDALVAALAAAQHARWRPGRAADRLAGARELIELTEGGATPLAAAEAHVWRALALLELCRLDEADVDLARHAELAESTQHYTLLVHREALRAMRALLEGDYERGAASAQAFLQWGDRDEHGSSPTPMHLQFYGAAMLSVLNERRELGRMTPFFERLARHILPPGWRPALAWAHVQSGRADLAREMIASMSAGGFSGLARDANYLSRLAQVSHVVWELGDAHHAEALEHSLAPFGGYWVVLGTGPSTLGPVSYCVGLLQLLQDRPDAAVSSFEQALELARRMRARPYVARSQAGLATALRRRRVPADAARADQLLAEAGATARALGMLRLQRELVML